MAVTKDQLTAKLRGKGGTVVRLTVPLGSVLVRDSDAIRRETYIVKDLFDRKTYNKPNRVGIGPVDLGLAFGVSLDQIELA